MNQFSNLTATMHSDGLVVARANLFDRKADPVVREEAAAFLTEYGNDRDQGCVRVFRKISDRSAPVFVRPDMGQIEVDQPRTVPVTFVIGVAFTALMMCAIFVVEVVRMFAPAFE